MIILGLSIDRIYMKWNIIHIYEITETIIGHKMDNTLWCNQTVE